MERQLTLLPDIDDKKVQKGVAPHRYQAKVLNYPLNKKIVFFSTEVHFYRFWGNLFC
ncbi:hypothetical protein [Bacillus mycoides]|uniref:hypothetical protein n=1 Tax=Bacillus mycoides TaxID=1405 RepID=UPI001C032E28|nr:hypothetical protein [Bacillus mycoides]MCQ6534791.1 hypothetical protein [Bacillus mycoides]QWI92633.1 hypothetical protein J5W00_28700 [Bacillus mycoides]QWJ03549.1 hypothetical protein J5V93_28885 [Bacillus mycoides]